jgi:8-oxo-dGTP pyrophosphatase MutT (NUDIX family)
MFKNKPNKFLRDESGKIQWISRSVAVVAVVKWMDKFLVVKRGPAVSNPNKWCVPCGYLDWNESASECVVREVYEESGLDLRNYDVTGSDQPYELVTEPGVNWKQDIAIHFLVTVNSETEPITDYSKVDDEETLDIKWITVDELSNYKFAFNHDKRILKCQ